MQKFLRTMMLLAVLALPFASQAQISADRTYLNEDFGVANPEGWTGGSSAYAPTFAPTGAPSWTYTEYAMDGLDAGHYYFNLLAQNRYSWLVSPEMDLTESGEAVLSYSMALTAFSGGLPTWVEGDNGKTIRVLVRTRNNANSSWGAWSALSTWKANPDEGELDIADLTADYTTYSHDFAAYLGKYVQVAFYCENTTLRMTNVNIHVDNVSLTGKLRAQAPTEVAVAALGYNTFTLTWADELNATVDHYQVRVVNGEDTIEVNSLGNAKTVTVSDLAPATTYAVSVRTYIDANTASVWSTPVNVFTHFASPLVGDLYIDFEDGIDEWYFVNDATNGWYLGTEVLASHQDTTFAFASADSLFDDETGVFVSIVDGADTIWNYTTVADSTNSVLWVSNDGGAHNTYTLSSAQASYAYIPVQLEAGDYNLGYNWRCNGEGGYRDYDYVRLMLLDENATLNAGTQTSSNIYQTANHSTQSSWQSEYNTFTVGSDGIYKLVLVWINDPSAGSQPPASIDNVMLKKVICFPVQNLAVVDSLTTFSSIALTWDDEFEVGTYRVVARSANDTIEQVSEVTEMPYIFEGLDHETTYTFTVFTVCGEGNESNPSASVNATTNPYVYPVSSIVASDITRSSAVISWTDEINVEGTIYNVVVCDGSDTILQGAAESGLAVSGLSPMTQYSVTVMAINVDTAVLERRFTTTAIDGNECGDFHVGIQSTTSTNLPTNLYYKYSLNQTMVFAEELGNVAGTLDRIVYTMTSGSSATRNLAIYIRPTTLSEFSAGVTVDGNAVKVFEGNVAFSTGQNEILFNTPYEFDGVSDLMIVVDDNTGSYTSTSYFAAETNGSLARYVCNDNTDFNPVLDTPSSFSGRPVMAFHIQCYEADELLVSVGERTLNTAELSWNNPLADIEEEADHFVLVVKEAVSGDEVINTEVSDLTYFASGLTHSTTYSVQVSAVYADGLVLSSEATSFETFGPCNAPINFVAEPGVTTISLAWDQEDASVETYKLLVSTSAVEDITAVGDANFVTVTGNNGYTVQDLEPSTTYYIYFYADCGNNSSAVRSTTVETQTAVDCSFNVTVNDGTTINQYVPIYGYYCDAYTNSQFVIPATSLEGLQGMTLTNMTFYASQTNVSWGSAKFEVYMAEVDATSISSFSDVSSLTKVMNERNLGVVEGEMVVTFDEPFVYNGGNLLIGFRQTETGSYVSVSWYGVSATTASISNYGYTTVGSTSSPIGRDFLPKVTFGGCRPVDPSVCVAIDALEVSDIDYNTATFSWAHPDCHVDGYQFELSTSETFEGAETIDFAADETMYIAALASTTNYFARVRSICGNDDTTEWVAVSLETPAFCRVIASSEATLTGKNSAIVSWQNSGNQAANYQYILATAELGAEELENYTGTIVSNIDTTSIEFTDLEYSTDYYFYVRNVCLMDGGGQDATPWFGPAQFTTVAAMPAVANLRVTEATHNTVSVAWERDEESFADETAWQVALRYDGSADELQWIVTETTNYMFHPVAQGSNVTIYVRPYYAESETSGDVDSVAATTDILPADGGEQCVTAVNGTSSRDMLFTDPLGGNPTWAGISQFIYPASLLTDLTGKALTSMTFTGGSNATEANINAVGTITFRLAEVENASFTSDAFMDVDMDTVFSGQVTVDGTDITIAFDEPFTYNGGNLLVEYAGSTVRTTSVAVYTRGETGHTNGIVTGTRRPNGMLNVNGRDVYLPNVKFCYDMGEVSSCMPPYRLNLESLSTEGAEVSWMPGDQETQWQYGYGLATEEFDDALLTLATADVLSATISGLLPDTDYVFVVRSICSDEDTSAWSNALTIHTPYICAIPQLTIVESGSDFVTVTVANAESEPENYNVKIWSNADDEQVFVCTDTLTITDLASSTTYYLSAQSNCGDADGLSRWSNRVSVVTSCAGSVPLPYVENFNSNNVNIACWGSVVNDALVDRNGSLLGAPGLRSGRYWFVNPGAYTANGTFNVNRYFYTPSFEAEDTLLLSFKYNMNGNYVIDFYWGYSTDADAVDSAAFQWTLLPLVDGESNVKVFLPADAKRVAFGLFDEDGTGFYLDENYYITDLTIKVADRYNLAAISADTEKGSVTVTANGDTVANEVTVFEGTSVAFTAKAEPGYVFSNWTTNDENQTVLGTSATMAFTPTKDTNVVANFSLGSYTVRVRTGNGQTNLGQVYIASAGEDTYGESYNMVSQVPAFTEVTVVAVDGDPNDSYNFLGWSLSGTDVSELVSTDPEYTFALTATSTLYAHFVIDSFNVAVNYNETMGTVTVNNRVVKNGSINLPLSDSSSIVMVATPAYGYEFAGWMDASSTLITAETGLDTMWNTVDELAFTTLFQPLPYYVYVASNNPALGTATATPDNGYYLDTVVLTATVAAEHYHFARWSDNTVDNPYNFIMTQDTIMVAFFAIDTHSVTLTAREDMGTVAINGENVDVAWFDYGTENVAIEAIPNTGVAFTKWSDDVIDNPRFISVEDDVQFAAEFDSIVYTIAVNVNSVEGTVYDGNEIEVISANGLYLDTLTFVAEANTGFKFLRWEDAAGNIYNTNPVSYVVTDAAEQSLTAIYGETGKINITVAPSIEQGYAEMSVSGQTHINGEPQNITYIYGDVDNSYNRFDSNTVVTLHAEAADHYHFLNWTLDGEFFSADADTMWTTNWELDSADAVASADFVAIFEIDTHMVKAIAENGSITVGGEVFDSAYVDYGDILEFVPAANDHYHFVGWADESEDTIRNVEVLDDITLEALFAIDTHSITPAINIESAGSVVVDGQVADVTGAFWFNYGDTAVLSAAANTGFHFTGWSTGAITESVEVPVYGNNTITANFDTNVYNVTIVKNYADNIATGATSVKHFAEYTYSADTVHGYHFVNWTDTLGTILGATNDVTLSFVGDSIIRANFAKNQYTITAAVNDEDHATVEIIGAATVDYKDSVTLAAAAGTGYHLTAWSNGMTGDTIRVQVLDDATITANVAINVYNVTASANIAERGTVSGAHATEYGALDTLVAEANYGYYFVGWNNGVETDTMVLTVVSDTNVVASFDKVTFTATAQANNSDRGIVAVTGTATYGDSVTFTAQANAHYQFVEWTDATGASVSTDASYKVQVLGDITLTAVFEPIMRHVVVNVNPVNTGSVNISDTNIQEGQALNLVATAAEGYHFESWSTSATDTLPTLTLVVNEDMTIIANFAVNPSTTYQVSVVINPTNSGTVTGNGSYVEGSEATVRATANTGYRFVCWKEGDNVVSTDADYTFTVNGDRTLVAVFIATYTLTVDVNDAVMGTVTPANAVYDDGDEVVVEATANNGYHFVAWVNTANNDTVSRTARYVFTIHANTSLKAVFERNTDGIDDVDMSNVTIYSAESKIIVRGAENHSIYVFDVNGRAVASEANAAETCEFRMGSTGVYLVKVGNAPAKRVLVVR